MLAGANIWPVVAKSRQHFGPSISTYCLVLQKRTVQDNIIGTDFFYSSNHCPIVQPTMSKLYRKPVRLVYLAKLSQLLQHFRCCCDIAITFLPSLTNTIYFLHSFSVPSKSLTRKSISQIAYFVTSKTLTFVLKSLPIY